MPGPYKAANKSPLTDFRPKGICFYTSYTCTSPKDIDFSALRAVQSDKMHKKRPKRLATCPLAWYHETH